VYQFYPHLGSVQGDVLLSLSGNTREMGKKWESIGFKK
jgi:hypothetical protein